MLKTLASVDPFLREFDRIADDLLGARGSYGGVLPMDVVRRDDEVMVRLDLPGVSADSIDVTVDRGVLSVSARRDAADDEDDTVVVRERPVGTFTRRVRLSDRLDADRVEASYDGGVLAVRIPVRETAKPRKVEVRAPEAIEG
ncbi:MAG: Hsp20/alpha crystallin family protein [Streptosporangiaceae bacterium]